METKPTQIIAEKGKHDFFVIREFDAPKELVFKAFSDPEILAQFYAPYDFTIHFEQFDFRSGGSYKWSHTDSKGKHMCTFYGVIHEVEAPNRFIQTAEFMDMPERGHVVMEGMYFDELPNGRTKLTIHDVCFSVEDRDAMIESGMEGGLIDIFDKLDKFYAK